MSDEPIFSMLTGKCGDNTYYCYPNFDVTCEGGVYYFDSWNGGGGAGKIDCPNCDCLSIIQNSPDPGSVFIANCSSNFYISPQTIASIAQSQCDDNGLGALVSVGPINIWADGT